MKIAKKILMLVLIINLCLFAFPLEKANAKILTKTSTDALKWLQSKVGQTIDYDGSWGGQCVDLIYAYYNFLGVAVQGGNACDYAKLTPPDGLVKMQNCSQAKLGDILVYAGGTGYGHVAIYESDTVTWHQNYSGQYVERVTNVNYKNIKASDGAGYWGVIRPNFSDVVGRKLSFSVTPSGSGSISATTQEGGVSSGASLASGTVVSLKAKPSASYRFVKWTSNNGGTFANAANASTTFTMPGADVTVTAEFEPIAYTLTLNSTAGGTITTNAAGSYYPGATITLTAQAQAGYEFVGWSATAGSFSDTGAATTVFTMPAANVSVTAYFTQVPDGWSYSKPDCAWVSKKQYRSRTKSTTTSSQPSMSGWTLYNTVYGGWSAWSDWSTNAVTSSDLRDVETQNIAATYKTVYKYNHYKYWNTEANMYYYSYASGYASGGKWEYITLDYALTAGQAFDGHTSYRYNGQLWFNQTTEQQQLTAARTEYRYRTRTATYYFYRFSDWSSWQDQSISADANTEVETRTLYRPKTTPVITTTNLANAVLGTPYSYALTAGGDAPITWTISSGTLPDGLTLAENGHISGIPTMAGNYAFTVKASNGSMADATAELTLLVTTGSVSENSPKLTTKALTGGSVTDYQNTAFAPGTVIYLSASPRDGFEFVRWIPSVDGLTMDENAADTTLVMPKENVTLTAVFRVRETDWSETKPADVTCLSKTQYSQRTKQTTTSTTPLSGWTLDQTTYGDWSAWSDWSTTAVTQTELQDVETQTIAATYKTLYKYNHYKYWNTEANMYYYSYGSGYASGGKWEYITLDYALTAGQVFDGYTSYRYNGQLWFNQTTEQQEVTPARTEYRYRTRSKIYHYSRWTEWSAWQDAPLTASAATEVRQRTLYKPDASSVTLPYRLRVKKSEQGVISDVGGAYNAGDVIAIKATPNSGYRFVKWKGDGKAYFADADSPETTLLMTASDTTVSAVYEALLRAEMPGWLTQIEAEAFMGNTHLEYVTIPEPCTSIGERAFAGCTGLYEVHIAHPNAQIAESAFKDCPNLTIYGTNGSTAQQYAQAHSIPFAAE